VIVCVVLTGIPKYEDTKSVIAPLVSAQKPPNGVSFVMRWPIVFTMRQPPAIVPSPIAACAERITHTGYSRRREVEGLNGKSGEQGLARHEQRHDDAHRLLRVVGACPSEYAAAETSCSTRNALSTRRGSERRNSHDNATVRRRASVMPMSGATTMNTSVLTQPWAMIARTPL